MTKSYQIIIEKLGKDRVKVNEPMAKHTTFRIGGPVDLFYEAKTEEDLIKAVKLANKLGTPFLILGNGSNLLVSDKDFRGIVIKNLVIGMRVVGKVTPVLAGKLEKAPHGAADSRKYLKVADLDFPDEPLDTEIEVYSGTPLQSLIKWSFENNLSGLQWFAGIPGTVGGAVAHNAHGYTRLFSNYLKNLKVVDKKGQIKKIEKSEISFSYDYSDILNNFSLILSANLVLSSKNVTMAKSVYKEWLKRKLKVQPQKNCPGSIFKNITKDAAIKFKAPTPAAGWLIDQCGLKGVKIGGAQISLKHANFIVNLGRAKASDVVALITLIKEKVRQKFGIELEEEIVRVGEF